MDSTTLLCMYVMLYSIGYYTGNAVIFTNVTFHGYRKWTPFNSTRNDMYCPEDCFDNPVEDERCCCCRAVTCWELDAATCNVTIGPLNVEYKDIFGSALFIPSGNYTLYEAVHRNGRLTKFPENLCEFADSLVKLDLSYNRLENISEIRCLNKLDTLRLDGNKIKEISNDTFSDMEYLRSVSLSRNKIEKLHPNTNQKKHGNILMVDFSYNVIETVDITNLVRPGPFCIVSCEGCEMTEQTNKLNYVMNKNIIHGPGDVILTNTSGKSFVNFTALGVHDYTELEKYVQGSLDYDGSSISCDCQLYPFLTGLGKDGAKYWPRLDQKGVICNDPEIMKGRSLTHMYKTQMFEELTCKLPDCPQNCTCTDKPSVDNVRVVCKGLTSMPDFVPVGHWNNDRIDLDFSDPSNDISDFPNSEYTNRLVKVNFSGNSLQRLDVNAAERLGDGIKISMPSQNLKHLPRTFHRLNPKSISFGANPVICDCDSIWIGDWIRYNNAQGSLQCLTSKGVVPAEAVNEDYLECHKEESFPIFVPILLAVLAVSIFLVSVAAYYFRYEIMLLKRKYMNKKRTLRNSEFDAMLTFSEENSDMFRWIEHSIIPALKEEGYSLFVPFYDISFGGNREHELAKGVKKSKNYVVFLCNKYLCDENSVQEFEMLWKYFCMYTVKNIIVINFDALNSTEIHDPRLRAFRRIREDLNFMEREEKLFERLKRRLGFPNKGTRRSDYNDEQNLQNTLCEDDEADNLDAEKEKADSVSNIRWNNRHAVRNTTFNCKYRKRILHAKDAFNVNEQSDWPKKRENATQRKHTQTVSHKLTSVLTLAVANSDESRFEC